MPDIKPVVTVVFRVQCHTLSVHSALSAVRLSLYLKNTCSSSLEKGKTTQKADSEKDKRTHSTGRTRAQMAASSLKAKKTCTRKVAFRLDIERELGF